MPYAPIALFTFKRPVHTRRALEALALNPEFEQSPLHIFCDDARRDDERQAVDEVRELCAAWPHPQKQLVLAQGNRGLAKSIRGGVNSICCEYGKVVVVEDDLVVSPVFLKYMNDALIRYENCSDVMQISGHNFPAHIVEPHDAFFLRLTTSWGWATWARAWTMESPDIDGAKKLMATFKARYSFDLSGAYPFSRMLSEQMKGQNDSWAIWWYLKLYCSNGLTLFPKFSLVQNGGFDGTGTHCRSDLSISTDISTRPVSKFPTTIEESPVARQAVRKFLLQDRLWKRYIKDTAFRIFGSIR